MVAQKTKIKMETVCRVELTLRIWESEIIVTSGFFFFFFLSHRHSGHLAPNAKYAVKLMLNKKWVIKLVLLRTFHSAETFKICVILRNITLSSMQFSVSRVGLHFAPVTPSRNRSPWKERGLRHRGLWRIFSFVALNIWFWWGKIVWVGEYPKLRIRIKYYTLTIRIQKGTFQYFRILETNQIFYNSRKTLVTDLQRLNKVFQIIRRETTTKVLEAMPKQNG